MKKWYIAAMAAALLLACMRPAAAMRSIMIVTKENQARVGLNFTLSAVRVSDTAVLVRMEIPDEGRLKDLRVVRMTIGTGSPLVSADLKTTRGANGAVVVSFQLAPELADKCTIDLVPDVRVLLDTIYAVQLKGYVTEKK